MYQLHSAVIYQHMLQGNIRIICSHFFHYFSPESGGIQYVGLIHTGNFLFPLACDLKSFHCDPADLILIISQGVDGLSHTVFLYGLSLSEIKASGQFPDNDHVKAVPDHFFL